MLPDFECESDLCRFTLGEGVEERQLDTDYLRVVSQVQNPLRCSGW